MKHAQILKTIKGPLALVGPALVYHDNKVSVVVASGTPGSPGRLDELILGELIGEILPSWADVCASVLFIQRAEDVTISQAREMLLEIISLLKANLKKVEAFDTDIALSIAYADRFPCAKSRQILNEIAGATVVDVKDILTPKADPTPSSPASRTTSDAAERARLTPKLRYDVLLRDNFRCRACGFGVESGAHLHIDHIHPISAGGLTEFDNLQALCSICNHGKGARK